MASGLTSKCTDWESFSLETVHTSMAPFRRERLRGRGGIYLTTAASTREASSIVRHRGRGLTLTPFRAMSMLVVGKAMFRMVEASRNSAMVLTTRGSFGEEPRRVRDITCVKVECMKAASRRAHLALRALLLTLMAGSIGASGQTDSCMALVFLAGPMATDTRESIIRE